MGELRGVEDPAAFRQRSHGRAGRLQYKGNDYRLIASINYGHQILFIKWLGTHREYDQIDAREVEYDEDRYFG